MLWFPTRVVVKKNSYFQNWLHAKIEIYTEACQLFNYANKCHKTI